MTKRGFFILAIVLWAQLVFGVGMTLWRFALVMSSEYQGYPTYAPRDYDAFVEFGLRNIPPFAKVAYVSPPGDKYTARYARWQYFLYPRDLLWLGLGPRESRIDHWVPSLLEDVPLTLKTEAIDAVIAEDLDKRILLDRASLRYDDSRFIIIIHH